MTTRKHAYVNFKADGTTIDFRVFAPHNRSLAELERELLRNYAQLLNAVRTKWGDPTETVTESN